MDRIPEKATDTSGVIEVVSIGYDKYSDCYGVGIEYRCRRCGWFTGTEMVDGESLDVSHHCTDRERPSVGFQTSGNGG